MNIRIVHQLFEEKGINMIVTDTLLDEHLAPHESYYKLQFEEGKWKFIYVQWERKNGEEKVLKEFDDEKVASRFFYLHRLRSYYLLQYIFPFKQDENNEDINVSDPKFNFSNLKEALRRLKIPEEYYSLNGELKEHSMVLEKVNEEECKVKFIGESYKVISETMTLENWEAYDEVYKGAYYIYLLDQECQDLIDRKIIDRRFSDEEYRSLFTPGI